jgi:ubiquinone biosynthesis protein COQ9
MDDFALRAGDAVILDTARTAILDVALTYVPDQGWTQSVLDRAIADTGTDAPLAQRAYPKGPIGLIEAFHARADEAMKTELARHDLATIKFRDRIALAVRIRLQALEPHRPAAKRALAMQSLPTNLPGAMAAAYRTADTIWHAIGDTSSDFSFYTKRTLVAGIIITTTLVWQSDETEEFIATSEFLERRISDVLRIGKTRGKLESVAANLYANLSTSFSPVGLRARLTGRHGTRRVSHLSGHR